MKILGAIRTGGVMRKWENEEMGVWVCLGS